jgi:P-type Mg2+ transporter
MLEALGGVDAEMLVRPWRWDIGFIRAFMLTFGALSSVFDYLTFGALLYILRADTERFRTGWFVESVLSAALVVLVVRTRHPFFRSRPGKRLQVATLGVILATLVLPFLPFVPLLGLTPLPLFFLALLALIVAMYIFSAELAKRLFYRHVEPPSGRQPFGTATV